MTLAREITRMLLAKRASITPQMRSKAKLHIIDTLGIGVAASYRSPVAKELLAALTLGGTSGHCGVLGLAGGYPPANAALTNGALSHILDYDDIHDDARIHPTSVTLYAALAAAEVSGAKGDALIDATIIGGEMISRFAMLIKPKGSGPGAYWFLSQLFGYLGGCFAAGVAMDFDEDQIVSSLGLAYMTLAGGKEPAFGMGSTARGIYTGLAAQGGAQAAILTKAGITGPDTSLDGTAGLFSLYLGVELTAAQKDTLTDPAPWLWADTNLKPWPSCRTSHPFVATAVALRQQVPLEAISRIIVTVNARAEFLCKPIEQRRQPKTMADAKYSIPFMVAFALAQERIDLVSLSEQSLTDPTILALAQKIEIDASLPDTPGTPPSIIRIITSDGREFQERRDHSPTLSNDQLRDKFLSCLEFSGFDAPRRQDILGKLDALETLSANEIFALFAPPSAG